MRLPGAEQPVHQRPMFEQEVGDMAWGWRNSGNADTSPTERSRVGWLKQRGITPMNRSTRLWDMEITAHRFVPHRTERVGSLDMARTALAQQRAGNDIEPIQWQGSQNMATGRAYDWCYCIEAAWPEADGRVECKCQCVDCRPRKKGTPVHYRKRKHAHDIRVNMIRHRQAGNTRRKRTGRRFGDWQWDFENGYWFFQRWGWFGERFSPDADTVPEDEMDTPEFDHEPSWYRKSPDPEEDDGWSKEI
jgi:hypothetical protein